MKAVSQNTADANTNKAAAQILGVFDDQLERLKSIRAFFATKAEALLGWRLLGGMCIGLDLIQLHRIDDPQKVTLDAAVDAKIIARAIGTGWVRNGNKWDGRLIGFPKIVVCLHGAEEKQPEPEVVEL